MSFTGTMTLGTSYTATNVDPGVFCSSLTFASETVAGTSGNWVKCDFGGAQLTVPGDGRIYAELVWSSGSSASRSDVGGSGTTFYYQGGNSRSGKTSYYIDVEWVSGC